ncbi:thioredoxin family protein [Micromonospora sp. NPDC049523]|uniref:TlpA family protein disulfide reductase n=1 Tax=Micromonospora sp. NPDC049523 TaxID=3155921 RepID=UPI003442581B
MQDSALTGPFVVVTVLVAATAFGLWRRRRDGRLRPVLAQPAPRPVSAHAQPAPGDGGPTLAQHQAVRQQDQAVRQQDQAVRQQDQAVRQQDRPAEDPGAPGMAVDPDLLTALGVQLGTPATLLQFSSAFCAPCRATRRVLGEVTGLLDGVRHVEVDAESQLDAVRALNVWRTPTVLVIDAAGRIVQRATGVPGKAQVVAVLAPLLTGHTAGETAADTAAGPDREGVVR